MTLSRDNTMGQMNFVYQCFFFAHACKCKTSVFGLRDVQQ